ncbi:MAG: 4Fe-4S cluster-binding domain-containing protein [Thermoplasmatota archaeon]
MKSRPPLYLDLFRSGELEERARIGMGRLGSCDICPRNCHVDRTANQTGFCLIGKDSVVSSYGPHLGEERPLVGAKGSGTVFFSGCNMGCRYCQNHEISQKLSGSRLDADGLADVFLFLQASKCHNVNLVSPSHMVPQILKALERACRKGFRLPLVYNTGGYDSIKTLKLLDGVVDIYMPDMKYSDSGVAERLSLVKDYPATNRESVKEMHSQVGDLFIGRDGLAKRGVMVRHLVLPNGLSGTRGVVDFLAKEVSKDTYVNIMDQYRPEYKAMDHAGMGRMVTREEYLSALDAAKSAGLHRFAR